MRRRRRSRRDGMRRAATRTAVLGCLAALCALWACAVRGDDPTTGAPSSAVVDAEGAAAALALAEADYERGSFATATARADSLVSAWTPHEALWPLADRALAVAGRALEAQALPEVAAERYRRLLVRPPDEPLRTQTVARLVGALADAGREGEAVAVALDHPETLDSAAADAFRELVLALDEAELRPLAAEHAPESPAAAIVHIQLAKLLLPGPDEEEARRLATGVLAGQPAEAERAAAERLAAALTDIDGVTARIGAILPLSGDLAGVGQLLREGIELAVDRYRRAHPGGFDVELVLADDGSDPDGTEGIVGDLEERGVVAIIGPFHTESFAAAAQARRNPRLPIISPTATEVLRPSPVTYTLSDAATLETDVAEDLARWIVRVLGLRRVAVLEPVGVGLEGTAGAFARRIVEEGGELLARERYDPSLTTFREPIEALAASAPDVVFAPAASPAGVLSVAPQLFYFGLYDVIVAGSAAWAEPAALRRLEPFATDHRLVGMVSDRVSPGTPWQQFVVDYEMKYRKPLRNNTIPALAHDAAALALAALQGARLPSPAALAAHLETGPEVVGVTGRLHPDAGRSVVRRATEVRMLVDGLPVEADRGQLLRWLAAVRGAPSPFAPRDTVGVGPTMWTSTR